MDLRKLHPKREFYWILFKVNICDSFSLVSCVATVEIHTLRTHLNPLCFPQDVLNLVKISTGTINGHVQNGILFPSSPNLFFFPTLKASHQTWGRPWAFPLENSISSAIESHLFSPLGVSLILLPAIHTVSSSLSGSRSEHQSAHFIFLPLSPT